MAAESSAATALLGSQTLLSESQKRRNQRKTANAAARSSADGLTQNLSKDCKELKRQMKELTDRIDHLAPIAEVPSDDIACRELASRPALIAMATGS